ncbi:hypothetical protein BGZ96_000199 [Linnemannia gamsii]|uniref:Uncharacterized protein n=1 Tax=Linnemannia gamsii TaxID=64522 RepID=A0ABQ7JPQ8_9FUNG|nr:hypothetical protein BGZ96_000199 [Linnemannia gamsii]
MRIPTIVLLSSVALSLLVNAENTPPAPTTTNPAVIAVTPPNAANIAEATAAAADTKAEPEVKAEESRPWKMKEDGKIYPVGKGIVYTKTTFVVDDNNTKNSKDGKEADIGAQSLLGDLLGIDINIGGGGGKKKRDPPTKIPPAAEETDPDYIPLYGDDGYKPRPVPKGCTELVFLDQMIWNQQGNSGPIEQGEGPESTTPPVSTSARDDTDSPSTAEADKKDTPLSPATDDNKDEKIAAKIETSSVLPVVDPKDINKKDKEVDSKGIRICLLGICIGDNDDDEDEKDGDKQKRRKIHHKQKSFLKQFMGRALKIDGSTGCPIPSRT